MRYHFGITYTISSSSPCQKAFLSDLSVLAFGSLKGCETPINVLRQSVINIVELHALVRDFGVHRCDVRRVEVDALADVLTVATRTDTL